MLLGAFFIVAVLAITSAVVVQHWSFVHRRAMEAELKFRGERIMRAILEFKHLQDQNKKPQLQIANYESLEKALTDQPNPILPGIPPDPMTARYDEQGELVEGTGTWGLVVPAGTQPDRNRGRPGTTMGSRFGSSPTQPGQPPFGRGFQVIGCEGGGGGSRLASGRAGGPRQRVGAVQVLGVASCLDDEDLEPIGPSPQDEDAATYKDWLFIPPGSGQMGVGQTQQVQGQASSQQPTWQSNWPSSLPAPPFPGGVNAPGQGNQQQIPGGQSPSSPFRGSSTTGGRSGSSSFGTNRP
jgi:hypothetical protein